MHASRAKSPAQAFSPIPSVARHELESFLDGAGWPGLCAPVVLAVHEAMVNAHRHGGGVTGVSARLGDRMELIVEVCDRGPRFNFDDHTRRAPEVNAEGGRGVWLMSRLATECVVDRRRGGNRLRLVFRP